MVATLLVTALAGCHLTGLDGTVSRSLVTSRQLSQQGVAALERGQYEHADEVLAQAVRACPSNAEAHRNYAEARWNRGFREEALKEIETARRLAPDNASILTRIAEMRLDQGQTDEARKAAQQAIALDGKYASAWSVRARVMRAAGNSAQALADYYRALSLSPDDRKIPCEVAALYLEQNQPQRALVAIQGLADKYSPGDEPQEILYYQGLAYLGLERYGDAAVSLSAAAQRDQPTAEILFRLAQAECLGGRIAEGRAAAEQSLAINPNHQPARALLAQTQLARQTDAPQRR